MPAEPAVIPPRPVETPLEAIQRLEERDPELAQMVSAFGAEWAANGEIDMEPELRELAGKYIPALQRALSGTFADQRDFILSEISHVANREPLSAPDLLWPAALKNLRKAYESQRGAIQASANEAEHSDLPKPDLDVKVRIAKYDGWQTVGPAELVDDFIEGHQVWEQRMKMEEPIIPA